MKRKVIRISLIVCVALLLATGVFLLATAGRTVEEDGLKQNTLRYMENVYFEDGAVHYTIVNRTHKKMLHGQKPYVEKLIDGKLCVLTGNTGAGKSTLLNAIDPALSIKTGETSQKLGRGRHTTRTTELYPLCGGLIADTPGFSAIETMQMELIKKDELELCYREFEPYLGQCRFTGCSHTKEKGCAVLQALEAGEIAASRHRSYCDMYEEAKQIKDWEVDK